MKSIEIWKDIEWYIGKYQVSNMWRVKSLSRIISNWWGNMFLSKEKILKNQDMSSWYKFVMLRDGKISKSFSIHRLVWSHFIGHIIWKQINHIDWNKHNNEVSNLEIVTAKENISHAINKWLINCRKKVIKRNSEWTILCIYESLFLASKNEWISPWSLSEACRGNNIHIWWFLKKNNVIFSYL